LHSAPLLEIDRLAIEIATPEGRARAVDGVSIALEAGRVVALVGESGCGKSLTAYAALGLLPEVARVAAGEIRYRGRNIVGLPSREMRKLRGKEIAIVFQEPMSALNPVMRAGDQVAEAVRAHERVSAREARRRAEELLAAVGIPDPARRYDAWPHELSGGMKQRVVIAIALAARPSVLIADEPTTALDVTVQAQVLELLDRLRRERGLAVLLITHNLGVVAELADEVAVMYAGRIVERAAAPDLFARPAHPYTQGLFGSLPRLGARGPAGRPRLAAIPGTVPAPTARPSGCAFRTRCPRADDDCARTDPRLEPRAEGRLAACIKT
jgi:oligopeptide/dipeptide ABC transporter ATP-binding protein